MKMNFKNLLLLGMMTLAAGAFTACSDSSSSDSGENVPVDPGYVPVTLPDGLANRTLSGIVKDSKGNAINNVTVSTGTVTTKTNAAGMFTLNQVLVRGNRIVVNFSKNGYFDVTRSCDTYQKGTWEVTLIGTDEDGRSKTERFADVAEKSVKVGTTEVVFPAQGFKFEGGSDYTGYVNVEMAYISPDDEDFADAMPGGDLRAIRVGGTEAELLSYGMIAVSITNDDGIPLNLREGKTAKVSFPIPESLKGKAAETIPLWWFNEETGKWKEDGEAKLVGDHYEGEVKHFSWWNLDYPSQQGTVEGHVRNAEGVALANITVHVGQRTTKTNEFGYFRQAVPAGEDFSVSVLSKDYGFAEEAIEYVKALNPYEVRTVDLTLAKLYKIKGRLMQDEIPLIGAISLTYAGKTLPTWISNSDGTFEMFAPANYAGAAKLDIVTAAGRKTLDISLNNTSDLDLGTINFAGSTPTPTGVNVITVTSADGSITFPIVLPDDLTAHYGVNPVNPEAWYLDVGWQQGEYSEEGLSMFFINYNYNGSKADAFAEFMGNFGGYWFDSDRNIVSVSNVKKEGDLVTFDLNGSGRCGALGPDGTWGDDESECFYKGVVQAKYVEPDSEYGER